jgi:hypothetical protein
MPTVICEGWEPEFIDVKPQALRVSREEVCGDANGDGLCSVSDIVYLSNYFYSGGPAPNPSGDADNDGSITPEDIAYLVDYFYFSGSPPCFYGWQGQMQVNEPDDLSDCQPDIATDINDTPRAVWQGWTLPISLSDDLFNAYWNGQSWSQEINIHPPDTNIQTRSNIAFDNMGNGICVWQEGQPQGGYPRNIHYASWDGGEWKTGGHVNEPDSLIDAGPDIAFCGGAFWVVWVGIRSADSTFDDVFASQWNGSGWNPEMTVNPLNEYFDHAWARLAVDTLGNPHVVWSTGNGCPPDIYYSTYDGHNWSEPFQVNEPDGSNKDLDPAIAIDDSGYIHVVWSGMTTDGDYEIYYSCFDGDNWSNEIQINKDDSWGDYRARVAARKPNNVWVCWDGIDVTAEYSIYALYFNGENWSEEEKIDSDLTDFDQDPKIVVSQEGCPWVIWSGCFNYGFTYLEIFCNYNRN